MRSVRAGITGTAPNLYSFSSFRQTASLPAQIFSARLTFWVYRQAGGSLDDDLQYLMVLDANYNRLETLMAERTDNPVWTQMTFDLQKYAGQTIRLHFGVYNDGYGGSSGMYVDDADLVICR